MSLQLDAYSAYLAGAHDFEVAAQQTAHAIKHGDLLADEHDQFFRDTLRHLWQARLDRGELPGYLNDLPDWRPLDVS